MIARHRKNQIDICAVMSPFSVNPALHQPQLWVRFFGVEKPPLHLGHLPRPSLLSAPQKHLIIGHPAMLLLHTFIHGLGLLLAITASFKFNVVAPGDLINWLLAPAPLYSDPKLFEEYVHPMRRLDIVDYYWQEDDAQLRRVLPLMDKIAVLFKEIGYTNYTWDSDVVAGAYTFSFERPRGVYENDMDDDATAVQHDAPGCTCLGNSGISPSVDQPQTASPVAASSSKAVVVPRAAPNTPTLTLDVDLANSPSVNLPLDGVVSTATAINASSIHAATQMSGTASVTPSAPSSQDTSEVNLLASLLLLACFIVFCIINRLQMLDLACSAETNTTPTTPVLSLSPSLQVQVAATTADDDKTQCMLVLVGLAYLAQVASKSTTHALTEERAMTVSKAGFENAPTHEISNGSQSPSSLTVVANAPSAADVDDVRASLVPHMLILTCFIAQRRPSLLVPENAGPCFVAFDDREFLASSSMPRIVELTSSDSDLGESSEEVDDVESIPSEFHRPPASKGETGTADEEVGHRAPCSLSSMLMPNQSQQAAIAPALTAPFAVLQPTTVHLNTLTRTPIAPSPTIRPPRSPVKSRLPVPIAQKQGNDPMTGRVRKPQILRQTANTRGLALANPSRIPLAPSQCQPSVIYATSRLPSIQTPRSYASRVPAPADTFASRFVQTQAQPSVIYSTARPTAIQTPRSYAYILGPTQSPNQSLASLQPTHHINHHPQAGAWRA
ncbi:unnamed protein product [Mycena citricolor]|uniref:Uncharacterized protein n=1 Tax=Mycena citricolor TaxID=2018698 RepID=A0AAD2HYH6_9AGAR|nr:unnamed protein product [Mycena citricolor]